MKNINLRNEDLVRKAGMFLLVILIAVTNTITAQKFYNDLAFNKNNVNEHIKSNSSTYEFVASNLDEQLANLPEDLIKEGGFGEMVAKKTFLLNKKYTSEEVISPGNPATKTVVKKPIIYQSVKRIERELKKAVKSGELNSEEATVVLNKVLDVALNILTADTRAFEKTLKSLKGNSSKIDLFVNRVTLIY